MILVTTATGHLGSATIDFLLKKNTPASQIVGLVRNTQKAQSLLQKGITVRQGDYFDYASLEGAFQGIDTLVLISSGTTDNRIEQHTNVIDAAKAAGVKHIIYTSVLKADPDMKFTAGVDHYHTEEALKQSGLSYTILRNTFYTDILPAFMGNAFQTGQWYYAAGNAKANFASRTDMAEALANVALQPSQHVNTVYEITSAQAYTFDEITQVVNKATGKTVNYIPVPLEALKEGMKQAGLSEHDVHLYAGVADAIGAGEFDVTDPSLEKILQRKPADLKDYLPQLLNGSH
jgi:NAD(P)H dehydrogenase (quinone)